MVYQNRYTNPSSQTLVKFQETIFSVLFNNASLAIFRFQRNVSSLNIQVISIEIIELSFDSRHGVLLQLDFSFICSCKGTNIMAFVITPLKRGIIH